MKRALCAAVAVFLVAAAAWADGIVLPAQGAAKPARTPDQRALVAFDGATETLVIETTLAGDGRDFAWIVPLPAAPKIEESTSGLFPTLEAMTGPLVETKLDHEWIAVAVCGLVAVALVRWGGRNTPWPLAVLYAYLAAGFVVALVVVRVPKMQETESSGGDAGAARVLSRESVGAFETAVLAVPDAKSLRAWLDANGFRAPDGIDAVAADYVAKGWVFVASKIRRDAEDDSVRAVRPLAFTFAAPTCVYPMRLTGVGNESLAIELFVFGPSRAEATGLDVEYCHGLDTFLLGGLGVGHSELLRRVEIVRVSSDKLLDGRAAVTKLVGTLDRTAMRDDVDLRWVPTKRAHVEYMSHAVALSRTADVGLGAFFFALVVAESRRRRSANSAVSRSRDALRAAAVGAGVALVVWLALPRLPSNAWEIPRRDARNAWAFLHEPREPLRDAASARAWVASKTAGALNAYTREPIREEDSPGNYVVRDVDGKIELVLYLADSRWASAGQSVSNLTTGTPGDRTNLRSDRTFVVEGTVRAADGAIVAGARLFFAKADPGRKGRERDFMSGGREATADAAGRFRVEGLADEKWDVGVYCPTHAMLLVEDVDPRALAGKPLDLTLPPDVSLKGRVVFPSGRGVPRAEVLAQAERPFFAPGARGVSADDDGAFELPGFSAATGELEVTIHVRRADGTSVWKKVKAAPGPTPAVLVFDPPQ